MAVLMRVGIVTPFTIGDGLGRRSYELYGTAVPCIQLDLSENFFSTYGRQCGWRVAADGNCVGCGQRQYGAPAQSTKIVKVNSVASDPLCTHLYFVLRLRGVLKDCVCHGRPGDWGRQRACVN